MWNASIEVANKILVTSSCTLSSCSEISLNTTMLVYYFYMNGDTVLFVPRLFRRVTRVRRDEAFFLGLTIIV